MKPSNQYIYIRVLNPAVYYWQISIIMLFEPKLLYLGFYNIKLSRLYIIYEKYKKGDFYERTNQKR